MKKNKAFTLAETLIVIGIIGVVAALTLPNLNHATGDKETVTKVKKIYSALTDAVDRAQAVYGDFDSWFNELDCGGDDTATCSERFAKRVTEFMKINKNCKKYKNFCKENGFISEKGNYKTSAECAYRFITDNKEFEESHTSLSDCEIEKEIFMTCLRKHKKYTVGIIYNPWRLIQDKE